MKADTLRVNKRIHNKFCTGCIDVWKALLDPRFQVTDTSFTGKIKVKYFLNIKVSGNYWFWFLFFLSASLVEEPAWAHEAKCNNT